MAQSDKNQNAPMDIESGVGERIHQARRSLKMSGKSLAALTGYSGSSISSVELGRAMPSLRMLSSIGDALDISLLWLATGEGKPDEDTDQRLHQFAKQLLKQLDRKCAECKPGSDRSKTLADVRETLLTLIEQVP
jgi:transcriptional regulator with XRE-family HTH domain